MPSRIPVSAPAPEDTLTSRPCGARPQQAGERDRRSPRPERVGLERLADDAEVGGQHALIGVVVDRRVVDEHVERVELAGTAAIDASSVTSSAAGRTSPSARAPRGSRAPASTSDRARRAGARPRAEAAVGAGDECDWESGPFTRGYAPRQGASLRGADERLRGGRQLEDDVRVRGCRGARGTGLACARASASCAPWTVIAIMAIAACAWTSMQPRSGAPRSREAPGRMGYRRW